MQYIPKPIDTTGVTLPPDIEKLTEQLAENAHDVWAAQRLAEGWSHGPSRDDVARKHPCLVPYSELPETEKDYDRQTALKTVLAIMALGYDITRKAEKG